MYRTCIQCIQFIPASQNPDVIPSMHRTFDQSSADGYRCPVHPACRHMALALFTPDVNPSLQPPRADVAVYNAAVRVTQTTPLHKLYIRVA